MSRCPVCSFALLCLVILLALSIVVYDAFRTPPYVQRIEAMNLATNTSILREQLPSISESENAAPLLLEALRNVQEHHDKNTGEKLSPKDNIPFGCKEDLLSPERQGRFREFVLLNDTAITLTHEACARPHFRHPPVGLPANPETSLLDVPETDPVTDEGEVLFQGYLVLARLIACKGLDALVRNDIATVEQSLNTLLKFPLLLVEEPAPEFLLRAQWQAQIAFKLIIESLNRVHLSDLTMANCQRCLEHDFFNGLKSRIRAVEFLLANKYEREHFKDWIHSAFMYSPVVLTAVELYPWPTLSLYHAEMLLPFLYEDTGSYRKGAQAYLARNLDEISIFSRLFSSLDGTELLLLSSGFGLDTLAQSAVTRTALAAARYRLQHGAFPETLDALIPEYLDAIPLDPFVEDAAIRYSHEEDRVTFSSIGWTQMHLGNIKRGEISCSLLK